MRPTTKIAAAIVVISIPALLLFNRPTSSSTADIISPVGTTPTQVNLDSPGLIASPNPSEPVTVSIPKLGVNTLIEPVGEDNTGRMATPQDVMNVSWWKYGAKPGEIGSVVLAGHLDTPTGDPAVFYRLDELQIGDEIIIIDANKQEQVYEVYHKQTFQDADFPIDTVFANTNVKGLNLITCAGSWDKQNQNYLDRLVVFSKLKES